jgi:glycosyltransferase involved in cell wall biosynthesis
MIVKNESSVILRCLATVKKLIDYWVIVDTGSTDNTQEIIKNALKDTPGELHERPWKNFAHNRNEALSLARGKADYLLLIDADDRLVFSEDFAMPALEKDCYYAIQHVRHHNHLSYNQVVLLIKNDSDFQWVGAIHEALSCTQAKSSETLQGVINEYLQDGHRSQNPEKLAGDIQILEASIQTDPSNTRDAFNLAKAYLAANDWRKALEMFEKRRNMGGRFDEKNYSLFMIGFLQKALQMNPNLFLKSFGDAFLECPARAEPLFEMTDYFIGTKCYLLGFLLSQYALTLPVPREGLFIDFWKYDWGILQQFFTCKAKLFSSAVQYPAVKKAQRYS